MPQSPAVTVLIPAYRPQQRFIDAIESLRAQTLRPLRVHVSFDHAPDHTPPAVQAESGIDFIFTKQQKRLGWVGNVNALLATVTTPYFLMLSHDDRLTSRYLELAAHRLESNPGAVSAHGGCRYFGIRGGEVGMSAGVYGDRLSRLTECLARGTHNALGWRGVTRSEVISKGFRLRTRHGDGLFSNHIWELELLLHGETEFCEGIFYDKYTDEAGLSRTYHRLSLEQKSDSLADNVASLAELLAEHALPREEQDAVLRAYVQSLLELQGNWNLVSTEPKSDAAPFHEARPAMARFVSRVATCLANRPGPAVVLDPPDDSRGH